jgi:hypothetical protein
MAGSYYMTLSSFSNDLNGIQLVINDFNTVKLPDSERENLYADEIQNAKDYWEIPADSSDPRKEETFTKWDQLYVVPGYGDLLAEPGQPDTNLNSFTYKDVATIEENLKGLGNMAYVGLGSTMDPLFYLEKLTGFNHKGENQVQDPIRQAAEYGGYLTEIAVNMIWITIASYIVIMGLTLLYANGWANCLANLVILVPIFMTMLFTFPLIFGIAAFLYV